MTQYLIMCRSLTKAQSSAKLLERAGITAAVVKAPQNLSSGGCGYAVSLHRKFDEAVSLLCPGELPRIPASMSTDIPHHMPRGKNMLFSFFLYQCNRMSGDSQALP